MSKYEADKIESVVSMIYIQMIYINVVLIEARIAEQSWVTGDGSNIHLSPVKMCFDDQMEISLT